MTDAGEDVRSVGGCGGKSFQIDYLGGGNSNIFGIFIPNLGEDEPILTSIFFKGVGSTTN